jgi:glutathione S-transferase
MPARLVDGDFYAQSHAIERFLARRFNIYGNGDLEALKVDVIVDEVTDIFTKVAVLMSTPAEKKDEVSAQIEADVLVPHLGYLAKLLGDKQFFLGDQLSFADIAVARLMEDISELIPAAFNVAPVVKALSERVVARPNIAHWISIRPQTPS